MKRTLAALISLALIAPAPSFALAAHDVVKGVKVPGSSVGLSVSAPVLPSSYLPTLLPSQLPAVTQQGSVTPATPLPMQADAVGLTPSQAVGLTPSQAVGLTPSQPVAAQISASSLQQTAQAIAVQPQEAKGALDARFDASAPIKAQSADPILGSESSVSSGLTKSVARRGVSERGTVFTPGRGAVRALSWASGIAAFIAPAMAKAQSFIFDGANASDYASAMAQAQAQAAGPAITAAQTNDHWGLWLTAGIVAAATVGYLINHFYQKAKTKRMLEAADEFQAPSRDDGRIFKEDVEVDESGAVRIPKRGAKIEAQKPPRDPELVYFDDVAGQDEAKLELQEVVAYLQNPDAYKKINPKYKGPKGVLMFGPPGTGKTLLARAVANEAGVPIVTSNGSDFINTYVGKGADNVRGKFQEARSKIKQKGGAAILFIDEIEAVGGKRTGNADRSEETRTINALLAEMDGFAKDNIIVIAATNRPDMLDDALLRGGRFGTKVPVGLPDVVGREAILKVHTKHVMLDQDVDLKSLAKQTPGIAGADLEQIVMDATKLAVRRGGKTMSQADLVTAVDEFTIGKKRKLVMSQQEKLTVAYHESGHAIVSHLLPDADPVRKVTIVPHGLGALGLMQAMPEEEKFLYSREWLVDRIGVALGGRVAEKMMTGRIYSGAQNDLVQATRLAKNMVMQFGMSDVVGHVSYDMEGAQPAVGGPMSERTRRLIDKEVKSIIHDALARVETLLTENKDVLETMAQELMEKETLRGEDMDRIIKRQPPAPPAPPESPIAPIDGPQNPS